MAKTSSRASPDTTAASRRSMTAPPMNAIASPPRKSREDDRRFTPLITAIAPIVSSEDDAPPLEVPGGRIPFSRIHPPSATSASGHIAQMLTSMNPSVWPSSHAPTTSQIRPPA
jgi:hypothetical protein